VTEQARDRLIILIVRSAWLARAQGRAGDAERLLGWARALRDGTLP
jgi:hypothetical protein